VRDIVKADGALYFVGPTNNVNEWLWRSDGTTAGTAEVPPATDHVWPQFIYRLTAAGSGAYFYASEVGTYANLGDVWHSDGTSAGTAPVRSYNALPKNDPTFLVTVGERAAYTDGIDLWYSGGDYGSTWKIDDVGIVSTAIGEDSQSYQYGFAGNPAVVTGDNVFFSTRIVPGPVAGVPPLSLTV